MTELNRQVAYVPVFVAELAMELLYRFSDKQLSEAGIDVGVANEAADELAECGFAIAEEEDDE
ncbi:hypothetical protein [Gulosibacter faecalis]|uniref:Uncharacterized protein n=1 Tax=Gulosibacter faecalis TaxID=272240 RepID=A0ABW5UV32_9MICO|nr:hypothetical protein [Gulosibacter faecalis]